MISLKEITHHNEHFTAISSNGSVSTLVLSAPKALFAGAIISVFPTSRSSVHPKFALHFPDLCFSISGGLKQLAIPVKRNRITHLFCSDFANTSFEKNKNRYSK